jgi:hypothetical protein
MMASSGPLNEAEIEEGVREIYGLFGIGLVSLGLSLMLHTRDASACRLPGIFSQFRVIEMRAGLHHR